ncbi:MAG TPA: hypothetical protein VFM63_08365 [Pyrinomonadaceae bacterium]|nr:hypothetical protein [Pyrinomonadaceae bacterium]
MFEWALWTSFDGGGVQSSPHIGSVMTGRGFGAASPESQCSDDLPAQHGIDDSAELLAIGSSVTANELRMKTARNRLTNEIVKERRRRLCKNSFIDRKVC